MVGSDIETLTTYEPYGNPLSQTGSSGTVYGFTGEQEGTTTGLVYLRGRYYSPSLKIFLSRDPFGGIPTVPASLHPYSYVHNNPINLTDPSGEFAIPLAIGGTIIVVGILIYVAITPDPPVLNLPVPTIPPPPLWLQEAYNNFLNRCISFVIDSPGRTRERPGIDDTGGLSGVREDIGPIVWQAPRTQTQPQPQPQPQPEPSNTPVPIPPDWPDDSNVVRVRHYSPSIDAIRASMLLRDPIDPVTLFVWVEYPITTLYEETAIQKTTESFYRPLNGKGGFVEFNVNLDQWRLLPDPNLPFVPNSKVIALYKMGLIYAQTGFPLNAPGVNAKFFNWRGEAID